MRSPKYLVKIRSAQVGTVEGWLPEEFSFSVESDWESPFAGNSSTFQQVLGAIGASARTSALSSQVWSGSSPVTLSLPMDFVAKSDAVSEVVNPVKLLMKMALPGETSLGGVLVLDPPGPAFIDSVTAFRGVIDSSRGDDITVSIGSFLRLSKVIVRGVSCNWSGRMSVDGYPMQCRADVELRTFTAITKDQIESMILT